MSFGSSVGCDDTSSEQSHSSSLALLVENRKKGPIPDEIQTSLGATSRKTTPSPLIDVFTLRSSPKKRPHRLIRWRRITSDETYSSVPNSDEDIAYKPDGGTDDETYSEDSSTFGNETDDEGEVLKAKEEEENRPPMKKKLTRKKEKTLTSEKEETLSDDPSEVLLFGAIGIGWKMERKCPVVSEVPPLLENSDLSGEAVTFLPTDGTR